MARRKSDRSPLAQRTAPPWLSPNGAAGAASTAATVVRLDRQNATAVSRSCAKEVSGRPAHLIAPSQNGPAKPPRADKSESARRRARAEERADKVDEVFFRGSPRNSRVVRSSVFTSVFRGRCETEADSLGQARSDDAWIPAAPCCCSPQASRHLYVSEIRICVAGGVDGCDRSDTTDGSGCSD